MSGKSELLICRIFIFYVYRYEVLSKPLKAEVFGVRFKNVKAKAGLADGRPAQCEKNT